MTGIATASVANPNLLVCTKIASAVPARCVPMGRSGYRDARNMQAELLNRYRNRRCYTRGWPYKRETARRIGPFFVLMEHASHGGPSQVSVVGVHEGWSSAALYEEAKALAEAVWQDPSWHRPCQ